MSGVFGGGMSGGIRHQTPRNFQRFPVCWRDWKVEASKLFSNEIPATPWRCEAAVLACSTAPLPSFLSCCRSLAMQAPPRRHHASDGGPRFAKPYLAHRWFGTEEVTL